MGGGGMFSGVLGRTRNNQLNQGWQNNPQTQAYNPYQARPNTTFQMQHQPLSPSQPYDQWRQQYQNQAQQAPGVYPWQAANQGMMPYQMQNAPYGGYGGRGNFGGYGFYGANPLSQNPAMAYNPYLNRASGFGGYGFGSRVPVSMMQNNLNELARGAAFGYGSPRTGFMRPITNTNLGPIRPPQYASVSDTAAMARDRAGVPDPSGYTQQRLAQQQQNSNYGYRNSYAHGGGGMYDQFGNYIGG